MELGPEDVSLLERCPHFRGWYVQASMELGPEDGLPKLVLPITGLPGPLLATTTGPPLHFFSPGGPGLGLGLEARAILLSTCKNHTDTGQTIYDSKPPMA